MEEKIGQTLRRPVVIYGNSFGLESLDRQLAVLRSCVTRRHMPYLFLFLKNTDMGREYKRLALKSCGDVAQFLDKTITVVEEIGAEEDASVIVASSSCCLPPNETDLECPISSIYEMERCLLNINQIGEQEQRKILAEFDQFQADQTFFMEDWQNLLNEVRELLSDDQPQRPLSAPISTATSGTGTTVLVTTAVVYLFKTMHHYYFCHKELGILRVDCNKLASIGPISSGSVVKVDIVVDEQKYKSVALEPSSAEGQCFHVAAVKKHTPDKITSQSFKYQPSDSDDVTQSQVAGDAVIVRLISSRERLAWNFSLGSVSIVNVPYMYGSRFLPGEVVHIENARINKKLIEEEPGVSIAWVAEAANVISLSDEASRGKLSLWGIEIVSGSILTEYIGDDWENLMELESSTGKKMRLPFRPGFVGRPSEGWPRDMDYTILTYASPLWRSQRSVLLVMAKLTSIAAMFLVRDNDGVGYFSHPEFGLLSIDTFSIDIETGVWCTLMVRYTKRERHKIDYNVNVCRVVDAVNKQSSGVVAGHGAQAQRIWIPAVAYVFKADTSGALGWNNELGLVQVSDKPQHDARYWAKGFVHLNQKFLTNPKEFMAKSRVHPMALWCFNDAFEKKPEAGIQLASNGIYIGTGVVKQLSTYVFNVEADKSVTTDRTTVDHEKLTFDVRNGYTAVPVRGLSDQLDCTVVAAVLDSAGGRSMFALRVAMRQPTGNRQQQQLVKDEETVRRSATPPPMSTSSSLQNVERMRCHTPHPSASSGSLSSAAVIKICGVLVDDTQCWQKQVGLLPISGFTTAKVGQLVTANVDMNKGQNAAFWKAENVRPFQVVGIEMTGATLSVGGDALVIEVTSDGIVLWNQYTGKVLEKDENMKHKLGSVVSFTAFANKLYHTDSGAILPYWYTATAVKSGERDIWETGHFQDLLVMRGQVATVGAKKKTLFGYHGLKHVNGEKPNEVVCYVGVGSLSSQSFDSLKFGDKVWLFCYKGVNGKFVAVSMTLSAEDMLLG